MVQWPAPMRLFNWVFNWFNVMVEEQLYWSSFNGTLTLVYFITGGKTGKIECPRECTEVWQWEKKNKTEPGGSVEQTFQRSQVGFMYCLM